MAYLKARKVGCEVYYPVPLHVQDCFAYLGDGEGAFPNSESAAQETLAIPIYPELTDEQQRVVIDTIRAFYAEAAA